MKSFKAKFVLLFFISAFARVEVTYATDIERYKDQDESGFCHVEEIDDKRCGEEPTWIEFFQDYRDCASDLAGYCFNSCKKNIPYLEEALYFLTNGNEENLNIKYIKKQISEWYAYATGGFGIITFLYKKISRQISAHYRDKKSVKIRDKNKISEEELKKAAKDILKSQKLKNTRKLGFSVFPSESLVSCVPFMPESSRSLETNTQSTTSFNVLSLLLRERTELNFNNEFHGRFLNSIQTHHVRIMSSERSVEDLYNELNRLERETQVLRFVSERLARSDVLECVQQYLIEDLKVDKEEERTRLRSLAEGILTGTDEQQNPEIFREELAMSIDLRAFVLSEEVAHLVSNLEDRVGNEDSSSTRGRSFFLNIEPRRTVESQERENLEKLKEIKDRIKSFSEDNLSFLRGADQIYKTHISLFYEMYGYALQAFYSSEKELEQEKNQGYEGKGKEKA